jgi:hypothetical protein
MPAGHDYVRFVAMSQTTKTTKKTPIAQKAKQVLDNLTPVKKPTKKPATQEQIRKLLAEVSKGGDEWQGTERTKATVALKYGGPVSKLKEAVGHKNWIPYVEQHQEELRGLQPHTLRRWMRYAKNENIIDEWCEENQTNKSDLTYDQLDKIIQEKSGKGEPRGRAKRTAVEYMRGVENLLKQAITATMPKDDGGAARDLLTSIEKLVRKLAAKVPAFTAVK